MLIEGEYTFAGSREAVWALLHDPEVLVLAMPGARELVATGPDQYRGSMRLGVGPLTAAEWSLEVRLDEQVPPERYSMQIDSKGALGFARGVARVELVAEDAARTRMLYRAEMQIGGRIAGVGQRLLDQVARMLTRQGLESLSRELGARLAAPPSPGAAR